MALHGEAVLAIWNGVEDGVETEFLNWHVHEHIPERVALPGFCRGRRYVAIDGHPKFFNFYEADAVSVFTSPAYRAALDTPSSWTQRVVRHFTDTSRTVCHVSGSWGRGEGAVVETLQLTGADGSHILAAELNRTLGPRVSAMHGVVGVHILEGQGDTGRHATAETRLRSAPDAKADLIVLVELTEPGLLAELRDNLMSEAALRACGAVGDIRRGAYALQFSLSKDDLAVDKAA